MWRNIVVRFRYVPEDKTPMYGDHVKVLRGGSEYYASRVVITEVSRYFQFWDDVKGVTLKDLLTWVETNRAN